MTRAVGVRVDISTRDILIYLPDMSADDLALDRPTQGVGSERHRAAIRVAGLRKSYDGVEAVRGIDFEVAVRRGLRPARAERRREDDDRRDPRGLPATRRRRGTGARRRPVARERGHREQIGVVLQHSELPPTLSVREVHRMFAGYYEQPRDVDEVIELVGLGEKRDARVKTLSGGQKRRLDLGVALVGDPDLVFLDEPTTGFDPTARRTAWDLVRALRSLGKTILLTTHYLDEAQQLADRVAVIREGQLVRDRNPARADRRRPEGRDPLPGGWPRRRRRDRRADARARRADRRGGRRGTGARGARGAAADPRGRLPRPRRRRRRVSVAAFGSAGGETMAHVRKAWGPRVPR